MFPAPVEHPFYYLLNFRGVLGWVRERHGDLLKADEAAQIESFAALPEASQALLVRMIMRKGELFRRSKLRYPEIGDCLHAVRPLLSDGWVEQGFAIELETLFDLCSRDELARVFPCSRQRKAEWLADLQQGSLEPRPLETWLGRDSLYRLRCDELCRRLRLMFFGNLRQGWADFVLADLGIYQYEKVPLQQGSSAFCYRADIDDYLCLQRLRDAVELGVPAQEVLTQMPESSPCVWVERRRDRLLELLARRCEREGNLPLAEELFQGCAGAEVRSRRLRILERLGRYQEALALAEEIAAAPRNEAEEQRLARILPRVRRKLGLPAGHPSVSPEFTRLYLTLGSPERPIEEVARRHFERADAPVYYVENGLFNALFGLLCWDAIFAPLPGAFFHPFQSAPADLYEPDFYQRRAAQFDAALATLADGSYPADILQRFRDKQGILSPFVNWPLMDESLLRMALRCLPATHLKKCFERMLRDIKANRSGMPDLIQFWPEERRYRLIEVKGPGDRLQDNQRRWLDFYAEQGMPVSVCHVSWSADGL